jgi:hypothetical protein
MLFAENAGSTNLFAWATSFNLQDDIVSEEQFLTREFGPRDLIFNSSTS